jgi:ribosomal protein L29
MTVIYDELVFVRRLESDGAFSRAQAEALSEAFHQAMTESVATKADMMEVRHEIAEVRTELRSEMKLLRSDMNLLRSELKLWTGSIAAALFASLGGLMTVFKFLVH